MPSNLILLAIPKEWNEIAEGSSFADHLHNEGFNIIGAFTYKDALEIIQSQHLSAVVMTSDWAIKQDDGSPGLIESLKSKVPTYSLITQTTLYRVGYDWFDELYEHPRHEYQSMPAAIDAVVNWLRQVVK